MKTLVVYEGSPDEILKHCTCDSEKNKFIFEGKEVESIFFFGDGNVKDWVREYIENYYKK